MRKIALILLFFTQIICYAQEYAIVEPLKKLSMITLIDDPEDYIEKKILIKGFLNLEKGDTAIYLSKDDYHNFNTQNAIFLLLSLEDMNKFNIGKMNRKYISIIGRFYIPKSKDKQFGDNYIGILKDVEHIEIIQQR